jgi:hypothetical protein
MELTIMPAIHYRLYSSCIRLGAFISSSLACAIEPSEKKRFLGCAVSQRATILTWPSFPLCSSMPQLSAEAKHHILLEYTPHDATRSFAALAHRHAVKGGERTIRRWHQRWNGTVHSLERKEGSGKARTLTAAEVDRYVRSPIRAANRAHRAIHYTELLPEVQSKTGKQISIQSLRRYGKEELAVKQKHTKKRTAEESECTRTCDGCASSL